MRGEPTPETEQLLAKGLLTSAQGEQIKEYRARNIFSLFLELHFLLYLAVVLFTTGAGIFIYQNIDTIGHMVILGFILAVTIACFYYSIKHSPGFTTGKSPSHKVLYDYTVLAANILTGIFIAYLQYQYRPFGNHYNLATLAPTVVYFISAYYFDHRGVLALGITGLMAFIGFTVTPRVLLEGEFIQTQSISFVAVLLGVVLIGWTFVAELKNIKTHFNETYHNFALHLLAVVSIGNLFSDYWYFFALVLTGTVAFYIRKAYQMPSINFLFFGALYGYIGLNILLGRALEGLGWEAVLLIYLLPFYFGGSLILFIYWLRSFRIKTRNASV